MIFIRGLRGKCCAQSQHWLDMSSWDLSLSPQHAATCSAWPSGQHESVQTDPGEPVGHERIHHMCEEPWMIFGWFSRQSWLTNPPQKKNGQKELKGYKGGISSHVSPLFLILERSPRWCWHPRNRFVFETCVSRCKVRFTGGRVQLEMTGSNWARVNEPNSDITSLAYSVKDRANDNEWHESKLPLWITLQCHLTWLGLPDQFRGFNGIIIHNWWISSATFDYQRVIKMTHLYRGAISNHDMAGWSLEP